MKVIIENSLKFTGTYSREEWQEIFCEFGKLINVISKCNNSKSLRYMMANRTQPINFIYGFGSNHMWVKEKVHSRSGQQVIFVEF